MKGNVVEDVEKILDTVEKLGTKNQASGHSASKIMGKKQPSKPKIRQFCVRINDYILEIVTSSHTVLPIKDHSCLSDALNQMIYCKSGDLLQLSASNKQVVLTLNPIVQNYEECKNALALLHCKEHSAKDASNLHTDNSNNELYGASFNQGSPIKD